MSGGVSRRQYVSFMFVFLCFRLTKPGKHNNTNPGKHKNTNKMFCFVRRQSSQRGRGSCGGAQVCGCVHEVCVCVRVSESVSYVCMCVWGELRERRIRGQM